MGAKQKPGLSTVSLPIKFVKPSRKRKGEKIEGPSAREGKKETRWIFFFFSNTKNGSNRRKRKPETKTRQPDSRLSYQAWLFSLSSGRQKRADGVPGRASGESSALLLPDRKEKKRDEKREEEKKKRKRKRTRSLL